MKYDEFGREIPDPTPVEMPVGFKHPPSLQEEIKRMIRQEMSYQASEGGMETFEEADDFEVDEDEMWVSPHELTEMQEEFRLVGDADGPQDRSRENGREEQDGRAVQVGSGGPGVVVDPGGKVHRESGVDRRGGGSRAADGKDEVRDRQTGPAAESERGAGLK